MGKNDSGGAIADLVLGLVMLVGSMLIFMVLPALLQLSIWLTTLAATKIRDQYPKLIAPQIFLGSGLVWSLIFATFSPLLIEAGMRPGPAWGWLLVTGAVWGLAVGHQAVTELEAAASDSDHAFTQVVDLPKEFYQIEGQTTAAAPRELTVEELEAKFVSQRQTESSSLVRVANRRFIPANH